MLFIPVLLIACLLDLLFGDPRWFPHPVRLIGWLAVKTERFTRSLPLGERNSGRLAVVIILLVTGICCGLFLLLFYQLPQPAFSAGAAFILYTTIAARDLVGHACQVGTALTTDLTTARYAISMIVGRDTAGMDESAIIRACVESVAENMSDGIIAPLFWATVGAMAGLAMGGMWPVVWAVMTAMLYKAVNTMDSMFGYKNEQYFYFGSCPARLDDLINFLPARLSGLAIVSAAPFCGCSLAAAWKILFRDHARHTSPNAGWPEAAMAGALGIQLGGDSRYFGKTVTKPVMGDTVNLPEIKHILQANRLILFASLLCLLFLLFIFWLTRLFF
jgi:adenosylcobinamide-phosphate synthase